MNKFKLFLLAALVLLTAGSVHAQTQKAGYINIDQMVGILPEAGRIDTLLQRYQADSINAEFTVIVQDYKYKDSLLTKTDTTKIPPATRRQYHIDLENDAYQVQNWQQISQNMYQQKQQELVGPLYQKVYAAINLVAKESGYAFVYREEALVVAPPGDNLIPLVAKKLNIKLPTGPTGGQAAGQGNPRPTGGVPKPTGPRPKQ